MFDNPLDEITHGSLGIVEDHVTEFQDLEIGGLALNECLQQLFSLIDRQVFQWLVAERLKEFVDGPHFFRAMIALTACAV